MPKKSKFSCMKYIRKGYKQMKITEIVLYIKLVVLKQFQD